MKALKVDHLGIAVRDLEQAVDAYRLLGFEVESVHDVPTEKVRAAFLPVGESRLELLEPTDPGSVIARFLEKRSGLHHVCVLVPDIDRALADLKAKGVELIDERPRPGAGGSRVAFVHPRAGAGVLLELKEAPRKPSVVCFRRVPNPCPSPFRYPKPQTETGIERHASATMRERAEGEPR